MEAESTFNGILRLQRPRLASSGFIQFLKTADLFGPWVQDCPLHYSSPNAALILSGAFKVFLWTKFYTDSVASTAFFRVAAEHILLLAGCQGKIEESSIYSKLMLNGMHP